MTTVDYSAAHAKFLGLAGLNTLSQDVVNDPGKTSTAKILRDDLNIQFIYVFTYRLLRQFCLTSISMNGRR